MAETSRRIDRHATHRTQMFGRFAVTVVVGLFTAQFGSYLVNSYIPVQSTVEINSFLHFTHIRNMGGVFGVFQGSGWIFAAFSLILVGGLTLFLIKSPTIRPFEFILFGLIVGGGASNILDRIIYGSVIDFIDVQQIPNWTIYSMWLIS